MQASLEASAGEADWVPETSGATDVVVLTTRTLVEVATALPLDTVSVLDTMAAVVWEPEVPASDCA